MIKLKATQEYFFIGTADLFEKKTQLQLNAGNIGNSVLWFVNEN